MLEREAPMRPPRTLLSVVAGLLFVLAAPAYSQCLLNGTYASTPAPGYSCCQGLISFSIQNWVVTVDGSTISVGTGGSVPVMTGTINCQAGTFSVSATVPGACAETYTLQASIQSIGSWTGTFTAQFVGADCSCFNGMFGMPCLSQQYSVAGALPPTSIRPGAASPPRARLQVGPNPLGATTTMRVHLDSRQDTRLVVRDVTGRAVATLVAGTWLAEGDHEFVWDGRTNEGRRAPSGLYFVQLRTNLTERVAKLVVLD
jgi:FlgD Ig-like domain